MELCDIGGDRLGVQPDVGAGGEDNGSCQRTGRLQLAAQRREGSAEPVATGRRLASGPEKLDQLRARMGAVEVKRQVGEQGSRLARLKPRNGPLVPLRPQSAKQRDPPLHSRVGSRRVAEKVIPPLSWACACVI